MKITTRQFAESLYEAVNGKSDAEAKEIINSFIKILAQRNKLGKADVIVEQFNNIWNAKNSSVEAEVTSSRTLGKDALKDLEKYMKDLTKADNIFLTQKIDKKILGGSIIKFDSMVLDGSLRTRMDDLKNRMMK